MYHYNFMENRIKHWYKKKSLFVSPNNIGQMLPLWKRKQQFLVPCCHFLFFYQLKIFDTVIILFDENRKKMFWYSAWYLPHLKKKTLSFFKIGFNVIFPIICKLGDFFRLKCVIFNLLVWDLYSVVLCAIKFNSY